MATKSNSREITSAVADDDLKPADWMTGKTDGEPAAEGEATPVVDGSPYPAMDALLAWCRMRMEDGPVDSQAGLESIIRQALGADNPEEILREQLPQSASNYTGIPLLFTGFRVYESGIEDSKGCPYYIAMDVRCGDPEESRVITTSSWKIVAQVAALDTAGEWPQVVMIKEMRTAKKGQNAPLGLVAYVAPTA